MNLRNLFYSRFKIPNHKGSEENRVEVISTENADISSVSPTALNGKSGAAFSGKQPFFLLGCVRSGTTLLRDILRMHPNLEGPEESHFFRWSDPFGTPRYTNIYQQNGNLRESRKLDGITEEEFSTLYAHAQNRRQMQDTYCQLYLEKQENPNGRWFDKTPQNIYGLFLLKEAYPSACFIHIHRNPLNVAASLKKGQVMPAMAARAAANYWNDSFIMMDAFAKLYPESLYHIKYQDFTESPQLHVNELLSHVGEPPNITLPEGYVYRERNSYAKTLTKEEQAYITTSCAKGRQVLGYV